MFDVYAMRKEAEQDLLSDGCHASVESPDPEFEDVPSGA